jgi:uncharacterized membrane-anchored protein
MKKAILILFVVMCLAQWMVPGKMIYDSEEIIAGGSVYKFKTEPIDPSDPFRGKYITLRFEADHIEFEDSTDWQSGEEIFVTFTMDSLGFAKAENVYRSEPVGVPHLHTTVSYVNNYSDDHRIVFNLPFDRYYLEESKASQAEQLYWKAQQDSAQVAYGLVRIGLGQAVLTDVMINERPIVEIIDELNDSGE